MSGLPTYNIGDARALQVCQAIKAWNMGLSEGNRDAKYAAMAKSAFDFYRGTNHLFWADFANDKRLGKFGGPETRTWLQGDLHTDNFGAFGNDEGEVVYNINDFDESVIADYQYDLWRMAVSIVLVAHQNGHLSPKKQAEVIDGFADRYLETLRAYADADDDREDRVVFGKDTAYGKLAGFLERVEEKSRRSKMLKKWTRLDDGVRRFAVSESDGKLGWVPPTRQAEILQGMEHYECTLVKLPEGHHDGYFKVKDIARRLLAGTGSLGVPRYYVLIEGDGESEEDDHILDVKWQTKPTAYHFLDECDKEEYGMLRQHFKGGDARWHEAAYRAMAKHTDDHLGWMELSDGVYSVRDRSLFKRTFPTAQLTSKSRFIKLSEQWGRILATDHSRALSAFDTEYLYVYGFVSNRPFRHAVIQKTADRCQEFQALVREVAFGYADQVEADWRVFLEAMG